LQASVNPLPRIEAHVAGLILRKSEGVGFLLTIILNPVKTVSLKEISEWLDMNFKGSRLRECGLTGIRENSRPAKKSERKIK
jgi:hypothetical protein